VSIFAKISETFYRIRKSFWAYPDSLFFGRRSVARSASRFYRLNVPFSHFVSIILVLLLVVGYFGSNISYVLSLENKTLIEGEIMGADDNGNPVLLNRINPLVNSNIQLEKDISELVYEPLIRVDSKGEPQSVLADYLVLEKGSRYQFKIKPGVKWHDGQPFTVDDVEKTFDLIRQLDANPQTSNLYSHAANKIDLVRSATDPDVFDLNVKNGQVIPGFFEAISFKIMPAHMLGDINSGNILQSDPLINRQPVGTGPFIFSQASSDFVDLVANKDYWGDQPKIDKIRFKLFPTESAAVTALETGQIHGLNSFFNDSANAIKDINNLDLVRSNFIYNQYWAMYFNLGDNGPAALKDVKVRQAISSAINRDDVISALDGYAGVANGPIPKISFAYNPQLKYGFDITRAVSLLNDDGYLTGADGIRAKGDQRLSFTLTLINNQDREAVAKALSDNLKQIGVELKIAPVDLSSAIDDHIIPRQFDLLLYGVQTLIDPDRFELFDSSQIDSPGLNLSSYTSTEKRTQVVDGKTVKVAAVDDDLNDGRRLVDEPSRAKKYDDFQRIIANEVPVVFLYHPEELYAVNRRIKGIDLSDIASIEQRFDNISAWEITSGQLK
jgi:peptide/nickel transport system substrate-binding protein